MRQRQLKALTASLRTTEVMFVFIWGSYISLLGLVGVGHCRLHSLSHPRFRFHCCRRRLFVSALLRDRDFADPLVDVTHDTLCHLHLTTTLASSFIMYDIQTLLSVPEGFSSKAIVTTLRAFGDKTNTMSLKPSVSKHAKADCSPPPRFPSRKASPTVALTSTTALRSWKPLSSTPLDSSQRDENAIPFPTAPACEQITVHDPPPGLKRPLPVEARRRRSGALVPPSARASAAVLIRPVAKRPRKSRRVLADLQFMASVHRSIVALHAESESRRHEALDVGVDAMIVDDGPGSRDNSVARVKKELRGLDQQLVARLVMRLRAGGFASTLMDARPAKASSQLLLQSPSPLEGTRAPPPSPEMDSGVDAMDVISDPLPASPATSPRVFRLPPVPIMLPPPPPPLGGSAPCSPPGLVSPRVPPQIPTDKLIYTMPQLVASHLLRLHERGCVRTPSPYPRAPRALSPLSRSLVP
jgi:hypothetical protein